MEIDDFEYLVDKSCCQHLIATGQNICQENILRKICFHGNYSSGGKLHIFKKYLNNHNKN